MGRSRSNSQLAISTPQAIDGTELTIADINQVMTTAQALIAGGTDVERNQDVVRKCTQALDDSAPDHQRKAKQFVAVAFNRLFP